jgi:hypothetical protein
MNDREREKMRLREPRTVREDLSSKRLLDTNEVCFYLSLGKSKGTEFAKSIGAEIKLGKRSLFDKNKIDQYLNMLTETKKEQTQ